MSANSTPKAPIPLDLVRSATVNPSRFGALLQDTPEEEWQPLFDAIYEANIWDGAAVKASATKALFRYLNKLSIGKAVDGLPDPEELCLSACVKDPALMLKLDPEDLRSEDGVRFLQRVGNGLGNRKKDKWEEAEIIDGSQVLGWTDCLFFPFPPLAFFTDAALASFFDLCLFGKRFVELDFRTVRKWRARWGLERPKVFLIRAIERDRQGIRAIGEDGELWAASAPGGQVR